MNPKFKLLFVTLSMLITMDPLFGQWVQGTVPQGGAPVYAMAVYQGMVFESGGSYTGDMGQWIGGVFLSSDKGETWSKTGFPDKYASAFAVLGTNIYASGIYIFNDSSSSWQPYTEFPFSIFYYVTKSDLGLLIATGDQLYRSTDNGINWTSLGLNQQANSIAAGCVTAQGRNIYVGGGLGLWVSTDNGQTWPRCPVTYNISALCTGRSNVLAGTWGGLYCSPDSGKNWNFEGFNTHLITCFAQTDSTIFAGTNDEGVLESTDDGVTWTNVSSGLSGLYSNQINALTIDSGTLYAATWGGVWRRPLSEMTRAQERPDGFPDRYVLDQNYPNPFNPSTNISYQLRANSFVVLKVYDLLGRLVKTLVNETQNAGSHSVIFNGSSIPSGVYFYTLEAGTYHDAKKLLLLK